MTDKQRHPTAIIAGGARLADDVEVGPYAVIEDQVSIGAGTVIGSHAVIHSHARIGARNRIHAHVVIADTPQDSAYCGEETWVEIGDDNVIREGVTIHRSTDLDVPTRVGSHCFLMAYSHVGHGCQLSDGVILTNNVMLAGHVEVGAGTIFGGGSGSHQFCRIGQMAMIGGNAKVVQDVLPFFLVDGVPALHRSLNLVGIRRSSVGKEELQCLKRAYRLLASSELRTAQKIEELECLGSPALQTLVDFIQSSHRGFCSFSR